MLRIAVLSVTKARLINTPDFDLISLEAKGHFRIGKVLSRNGHITDVHRTNAVSPMFTPAKDRLYHTT